MKAYMCGRSYIENGDYWFTKSKDAAVEWRDSDEDHWFEEIDIKDDK